MRLIRILRAAVARREISLIILIGVLLALVTMRAPMFLSWKQHPEDCQ